MSKNDWWIGGLIGLLLGAILTPFALIGVDPHHDGIMLKPALDVVSGQVLFRDTFMQYGALTCYLQAAALWIHPSLISIRLLGVVAYMMAVVLLYASWRAILPRSLAILSCVAFALFIPYYDTTWKLLPWSSAFALMFQALALYGLVCIAQRGDAVRWGVVAGIGAAASFWCRQPVGTGAVLAVVITLAVMVAAGWRPRGRSLRDMAGAVILGLSLVSGVLLGSIVATGALKAWWYQNFIWPGKWATATAVSNWDQWQGTYVLPGKGLALLIWLVTALLPVALHRALRSWPRWVWAVYYVSWVGMAVYFRAELGGLLQVASGGWTTAIPMVMAIQGGVIAWVFWKKRGGLLDGEFWTVAGLWLVSAFSLTQYYPVPCAQHTFWSLSPAFGLFAYGVWRYSKAPAAVVAAILGAALVPLLLTRIEEAKYSLGRPLVTLHRPAAVAGMRVLPEERRVLEGIDDALQRVFSSVPDKPVIILGADALYLCFANNLENPNAYYVTWRTLADEEQVMDRWRFIFIRRPIIVVQKPPGSPGWALFLEQHKYTTIYSLAGTDLEIAAPSEVLLSRP